MNTKDVGALCNERVRPICERWDRGPPSSCHNIIRTIYKKKKKIEPSNQKHDDKKNLMTSLPIKNTYKKNNILVGQFTLLRAKDRPADMTVLDDKYQV